MSLKDPWMELADIVLDNLEDWEAVVEHMTPKGHPPSARKAHTGRQSRRGLLHPARGSAGRAGCRARQAAPDEGSSEADLPPEVGPEVDAL